MILGISGLAGSGKDTLADFLVKDFRFVKLSFADPMKRICKEVFDFTDEQLWGPSARRNAPDLRYMRSPAQNLYDPVSGRESIAEAEYLTPRYALQHLGSEWGRDCYHNVWVDYAIRTAKKVLDGHLYDVRSGVDIASHSSDIPRGVAIPDVRFRNELMAIKAAGGKVVRVKRGTGLVGAASQHRSEQELMDSADEEFDFVIDNTSLTLDGLKERAAVLALDVFPGAR